MLRAYLLTNSFENKDDMYLMRKTITYLQGRWQVLKFVGSEYVGQSDLPCPSILEMKKEKGLNFVIKMVS